MPSFRAPRVAGWSAGLVSALLLGSVLASWSTFAQQPSTVPPGGLRDNTPTTFALVHATVIPSPGERIPDAAMVFRDGVLVALGPGASVKVPADARVIDCAGKTIYPGLIDAFSELAPDASKSDPALAELLGSKYWNANIVPQVRAARIYKPDIETNRKLRAQGIVARLVAPGFGNLKGTSAVVTSGDETGPRSILREQVAQHASLIASRRPRGEGESGRSDDERGYPTSPMGALALVRQALHDAMWYAKAHAAYANEPTTPRPESNDALAALAEQLDAKLPFVVDASDELYFMRADKLGREFGIDVIVRGAGQEYRRIDDVVATRRSVILPVNFPRPPDVSSPDKAANVSLEDLMDWDLAPENPARLERAGVRFAFSTHGLRDRATFLAAVRKAVVRGLNPDAALRAMTVTPADLLGLSARLGTLAPGKAASFVITDGELFNEKSKVLETWIDGRRHEIAPTPLVIDPRGRWTVKLGERELIVTIAGELERLTGRIGADAAASQPADEDREELRQANDESAPQSSPSESGTRRGARPGRGGKNDLQHVALQAARLTFVLKGEAVGEPERTAVQVAANLLRSSDDKTDAWLGSAVLSSGKTVTVTALRTASAAEVASSQSTTQPSTDATARATGARTGRTTDRSPTSRPVIKDALYPVNYPLGDFGRDTAAPPTSTEIYLHGARIWTCGPAGIIEDGHILIRNGKIERVGQGELAGAFEVSIDCKGKQVSPGIIDCHSHIATDGGVNESGQAVTAEVRIGDFINPDDINIYRQLAGGVTSSNILHGSANPIGGQNQVIKLRWGASADQLKFESAPPGIKFALGENVKQSNWDIPESRRTRYPQSRMGVEQIILDEFKAALDYKRSWQDYESRPQGKLPPRRDLELDAVVEILDGKRLIHCHSYRQDEILAFLRVCEAFQVKIATLQHILEGYKVADVMAKHGAGGSSFSDWWAYKIEVYDAIPYNGALMHDAGVVVSFNSDDAELARRLNLEAAKAVKYGGLSEAEALKFVTLNPAKQLRVDDRVGSIEVGKDADLVVWSGSPLSTLARVEQTWVDGRKYFDRNEDLKVRDQQHQMRVALVQRLLTTEDRFADADDRDGQERTRDMFPNEDIYCGHSEHGGTR